MCAMLKLTELDVGATIIGYDARGVFHEAAMARWSKATLRDFTDLLRVARKIGRNWQVAVPY
ncbi:MAG: hypothetical protein ACREEM_42905 [Blastocatellia bacterium]